MSRLAKPSITPESLMEVEEEKMAGVACSEGPEDVNHLEKVRAREQSQSLNTLQRWS